MKNIIKIFALIFCFANFAKACALCAAYTPSAHVFIKDASVDENLRLKKLSLAWSFSPQFSEILLQNYDMNGNLKFDEVEFKGIEKALKDYVNAKNQLSFIYESAKNNLKQAKALKFKLDQQSLSLENKESNATLLYEYTLILDADLKSPLAIKIFDDEGFFDFFFLNTAPLKLKENLYLLNNANLNVSFLSYTNSINDDNLYKNNDINTQKISQENLNKNESFLQSILIKLRTLNAYFIALLKDEIHSNSFFSILILMILSLCYGMFHVAAPGHSKLLVSSYFLAFGGSYLKALSFAFKVALVHIMSAFLLVFIAFFILKTLARNLNANSSLIVTQFSSILIIFISLYLLSKKILKNDKKCLSCDRHSQLIFKNNEMKNKNSIIFAKKNQKIIKLNLKAKNKFSEIALIIAAGAVPCPTMVLVFSLAFEFGTSKALLSAVFIALGMAFVLFVCGLFALRINLALRTKYRIFLEYIALIFMILLGFFIFFNAKMAVF